MYFLSDSLIGDRLAVSDWLFRNLSNRIHDAAPSNSVGNTKGSVRLNKGLPMPVFPPFAKAIEVEVNHRCGIKCEGLTKDEASDDRYAKRSAQLGTHAGS